MALGLPAPRAASQFASFFFAHLEVVARPVFRVSVCGAAPKHFHEAEALQVHHLAFFRNLHLAHGAVVGVIRIDLPVAFKAGEEESLA